MIKRLLQSQFDRAYRFNIANIGRLIGSYGVHVKRVCDLGAGDGSATKELLATVQPEEIHVVEIEQHNASALGCLGYVVHRYDLNESLTLPSDYFDVVIANQVIEHLYDTDHFLEGVFRVVRPGGIAVISTENLASWHNVMALLFGWQPFSLTNVTYRVAGVGNPMALHRNEAGAAFPMQHHRLFTGRSLKELFRIHGFAEVRVLGSGYYPFPPSVGVLEPQHAHFIAVSGRKPGLSRPIGGPLQKAHPGQAVPPATRSVE